MRSWFTPPAIQRASVAGHIAVRGPLDLGMTSRDGDVVEADLTVGMSTEFGGCLVERKASAGLCPCAHDENAEFEGQVADRDDDVIVRTRCVLQRIDRREGDGAVAQGIQWFTAARTEGALGWVPVAALVAEHVRTHVGQPSVSAR